MVIGDFRHGVDGFATSSPSTDPNMFPKVMETVHGPQGVAGLHMLGRAILRTQKLNDPKWQAPRRAKLGFLIQVPRSMEFDVVLIDNEYTPGSRQYTHHLKLEKQVGWQEIVLTPDDFRTEKNQILSHWQPFDALEFGSKHSDHADGVTFANIRWIVP